ncbi:MAG: anthranilate phosphoribosyltransferase, partial [Rothia mucilaginosa]|nr:anthranilate phosphoribosyltransferase [Rothia mucilaginosa]
TIATTSRLWEAADGKWTEYRFDPTEYGLQNAPLEQLRGGDAEYNAGVFRAILAGEGESPKSPLRAVHDAVLINAAAGLVAYRPTNGESFEARFTKALADARESIASGAAERVLNAWVEFSEKHAEG